MRVRQGWPRVSKAGKVSEQIERSGAGVSETGKANIVTMPPDEEIREKFEAYCMAIGKAAFAWNILHESLGQLFAALSDDRVAAVTEWYSKPPSDDRQRKMLERLLTNLSDDKWPASPKLKADGLWLIAESCKLADDRNNAVHAPATLYFGTGYSEMGPSFIYGHPRAKILRGRRLLEEFAWCETCTENLTLFTRAIETSLGYPDRYGWPERPNPPPRPTAP